MKSTLQRTGRTFQDVYREQLPTVYRIAFTYLKNSYDSEDAAHETFLRLMRRTEPFQNEEHEKAWLIVTVSNVCKDMLRRKHRQDASLEDYTSLAAAPYETDELLEAVMALPDSYKTAVYLYYYEGYSVKETAKLLGSSPETVKSWLRRARKKLREQLGEDFNG